MKQKYWVKEINNQATDANFADTPPIISKAHLSGASTEDIGVIELWMTWVGGDKKRIVRTDRARSFFKPVHILTRWLSDCWFWKETHRASVRLLSLRLLNVKYEKCFVNAVQNIVPFKLWQQDWSTCSFLFWRNWARRLGLDGSCLGLGTEAGDDWGLPLTCESAQRRKLNHTLDSQISIIYLYHLLRM